MPIRAPERGRRAGRACCSLAGALLVVLSATGCGNSGASDTTAGTTARPAPAAASSPATAAPLPPAAGRPVRFKATDGVPLKGTLTPVAGRRSPGIVLVHQSDGGPDQWDAFVPVLHRAGYATLAYGSRGTDTLDETVLTRDVAGAVAALRRQRGVDAARIAVVGASIGASTAAWTISTRPKLHLKTAVGLSPAESPAFIDTGTKGGLHPHDLLLLSDRAEFTNVQGIAQDAGPGVTARRVSVTGHGVTLLTDRAVQELVLSWLRSHLAPRA